MKRYSSYIISDNCLVIFNGNNMNIKLQIKQYIKMFAQNCILPVCYNLYRRKPVIPGLVIFADAHHNSRPQNMQLLYEKLGGMQIVEMYLDYQQAPPLTVLRHMLRFMKLYAQASCVVICDNFLPAASCRKRKETRVIQLWHACGALKRFGYDTSDDIPVQYHGNVFQNIDLVPVSSEKCVKPFASAMRLPAECVQPLGVSRTDVYFQDEWKEECRREFYHAYPEAQGKKIVLWAPTFRGNPGAPELPELNLKNLQERLGKDWLVLCRVHPHMHEQYKAMDCRISTERLFPVIDVLIADYSSLIFEFLLFHKPLVLYAPDLTEYQEKRGFYLDFNQIPGYLVIQEAELPEAVEKEYLAYHQGKIYNEIEKCKERDSFVELYMSGCDGHSTDRIVDYMKKEIQI